jgi:CO/xanthine dehydrogenase Mo-binding subunit
VLRSPHAHAKIISMDIKAAAEMRGVEAVYTGADLIEAGIGSIPTLSIQEIVMGLLGVVPAQDRDDENNLSIQFLKWQTQLRVLAARFAQVLLETSRPR